ncbi:MAG: aminopeptidase P family protein [Prolixibacteraceae bacterium]|jgi:Xaa-Pro aminopeptidase|nr:aminopeptidase P family protein [Prolixibacteraceae bacterium]MBT6005389.1 aminopeptidase P family protein [Prolixibacteraceae bacterium]MBT6765955.1 aminopeptidase P family protein [Prolixibacteraceae bacterium]MBT7000907.1 aminopeptidase P family protein [Prolixibacteraceae bacterium]MBT7394131.1 aminopeptidase P family protein [Prolixibacteraceae bacterium]
MFEKSTYENRRKALKNKHLNGVALILGNVDSPMNYPDNTFHFRQDSSFLYFFGLDFPGLAGVIDFDSGEDYIFGDDVDIADIIWMGPQISLKENAAKVGVENTAPFNKLFDFISGVIKQGRKIHILPPYRGENKILLEKLLGISALRIQDYVSLELVKAVIDLRSVKEICEIDEITKACAAGYDMHVTAMKMAKPGNWEQKIAGTLEGIANSHGGMLSFPIILSQNGETLHNHDHSQILKEGRLMLTDAGAETSLHYASDFTRTVPVGGKFTQKQKEIYEIVLAANNHATSLTKPGVTYLSVHLAAAEVIASGLKELGLMKGDVKEAVKNGAHALFLPHGLGHMMGLDVHDMEDLGQIYVGYDHETRPVDQFGTAYLRLGRKLQPGFVITNEPGIYFIPALIDKWQSEKINSEFINFDKVNEYRNFGGIRLEDDILVTKTGSEIIGKRIPIEPDEIEEIVGK